MAAYQASESQGPLHELVHRRAMCGSPRLELPQLVGPWAGQCLASRFLGDPLKGGMPLYKFVFNRLLTGIENLVLGRRFSEYHTGYRAFSRRLLETLPLEENDDDFVFDNQMLVQALHFGFKIAEVTCPTRYATDSSSINFRRSVKYGIGVLETAVAVRLARSGLSHPRFLAADGRKLGEP